MASNKINTMKKTTSVFAILVLLWGCSTRTDSSDAYGTFEAETLIVSAETPGKILTLHINEGDNIEAGIETALIDTLPLHLQLKQIDAQKAAVEIRRQSIHSQVDVFKAQKETLLKTEARIKRMLQDGAATQQQLDDIQGQINVIDKQTGNTKTQFSAVEKELEVLDAQKSTLLDQLKRCSIKAPVSGTVLETYAEQGELATAGKPLYKMADLSELELKVYVSGAQLPNIKLGQEVEVLVDKTATTNRTLSGVISWISAEAEFTPKIIQTKEERVKLVYAVKVRVKNDGTLKIGMPGEMAFRKQ